MKLNEKIILLRKRAGMSQEDLANKLDISRQAVYKWESDSATPDLNNIKKMSQIFNISYDQLLDDNYDLNTSSVTPKPIIEKKTLPPNVKRECFRSYEDLYNSPADVDHGYLETMKAKVKGSHEIFARRYEKMKQTMASFGAEFILLIPESATAFFYNNTRYFFGLYYNGAIQFVCPYENYISSTVTNSGMGNMRVPETVYGVGVGSGGVDSIAVGSYDRNIVRAPYSYNLIISYFENNNPREINLTFSELPLYCIYENNFENGVQHQDRISNGTNANLTKIKSFLDSLPILVKNAGDQIYTRTINIERIKNARNETRASEEKFMHNNRVLANDQYDMKALKGIIIAIVVIGLIVLFFVIMGKLFTR